MMIQRITPKEYFTLQEEDNNMLREGIILGAILIVVGVILGSVIMYIGVKH